jgi:hypothetical protein
MLNDSFVTPVGQQRQLNAVDGQVTPDSAVPNFPCCSKIVLEDTVTVKKASQLSVETFDPRCITYPYISAYVHTILSRQGLQSKSARVWIGLKHLNLYQWRPTR